MIHVSKHLLKNGLQLVHHEDKSTQMVAVNVLYNVGAKDESANRTGFAHLFEHLMFGGSLHIPNFDSPLQEAGGQNNAWTSNDVTNYYCTVPKENIETALWLESDRMLGLDFSQHSLDVQKSVVVEEFKQRCLNQPYGDLYLLLRPLAYREHPYQWATIGKEPSHIEETTLDEVKSFFYKHYAPNNAILSIAGNISFDTCVSLVEKWFGDIEQRDIATRNLPIEPQQTEHRQLTVERDVQADMIVQAYHIFSRMDERYPVTDILSDLLSNGRSARLFQRLVIERGLFSELDAHISGEIDPGLFFVQGKLSPNVTFEEAETAINEQLQELCDIPVSEYELEKVVNKFESNHLFSNLDYLSKASNLAYYQLLGDAEMINYEVKQYRSLTPTIVQQVAQQVFRTENRSTLYYKMKR